MSEDLLLRRLLESVARGMFSTSEVPDAFCGAWEIARRRNLVAVSKDDDDCVLTDAGLAELSKLREGPNRKPPVTIGSLISQLEASERTANANAASLKNIEGPVGDFFRINAAAQQFHADLATMPGIDRIEHLCDVQFDGTGLTAANVRKLRAQVCKKLKWNSEQAKCADGLTLTEVADVLEDIHRIPFDVNWWDAVAAIASSQWAWDSHPLGNGHGQHRDAQAKTRIERGRNLQFKDIRFYSARLPAQGETFGVTIHDANNNQLKWGVGRQYYVPTADDLAIVQELYPNTDPENPSWTQVETDLVLAGKDKKELRQHNAATLIRLLQKAIAPPAGANADEGTDGAKNGKQKRRGAPVATDEKADKRLCADWKTAKGQGMTREAFAREKGISVNDIIAAQNREKYRRQRDAE